MRLCATNSVYGRRFASHPQLPGVCVRIDGTTALIMWDGDHIQAPIAKIPTNWWRPIDKSGRPVAMRIRRPLLGTRYNTLDVEFLAPEAKNSSLPSANSFWVPLLTNLVASFVQQQKKKA